MNLQDESSEISVTVFELLDNEWNSLGSTEKQNKSDNMVFQTTVSANFTFEMSQKVKFIVNDGATEGNDDYIGKIETTVSSLIPFNDQVFQEKLLDVNEAEVGLLKVELEPIHPKPDADES